MGSRGFRNKVPRASSGVPPGQDPRASLRRSCDVRDVRQEVVHRFVEGVIRRVDPAQDRTCWREAHDAQGPPAIAIDDQPRPEPRTPDPVLHRDRAIERKELARRPQLQRVITRAHEICDPSPSDATTGTSGLADPRALGMEPPDPVGPQVQLVGDIELFPVQPDAVSFAHHPTAMRRSGRGGTWSKGRGQQDHPKSDELQDAGHLLRRAQSRLAAGQHRQDSAQQSDRSR